jgi:hypothetical protein
MSSNRGQADSEPPQWNTMHADDNDLRKSIDRLLRRRPGWSFQATSTPGTPLVWCFGSGSVIRLSVTVDGPAIRVHHYATDQDTELKSPDELVQWLRTHMAGALQEPRSRMVDKLKSGRFFKWE